KRGAVLIKVGLTLYDLFTSNRHALPAHQFRGRAKTMDRLPDLNPAARASATYYDAWVSHPERLALEMLQEGIAAGGLALNHATVSRVGDNLVISDAIGGEAIAVNPELITNATGGWIDLTNAAIEAD